MSRISRAKPHLTIEEVQQKIAAAPNIKKGRRWLVIYNAMVAPRLAQEIALHVGLAKITVNKIISAYNKYGAVAIDGNGNKIRNKAYLSLEEEKEVLQPFIEAARKGDIATTAVIHAAFEQKIGKEVDPATTYRILERQEWRKVVPRSYHPKTNKEERELFKKLP